MQLRDYIQGYCTFEFYKDSQLWYRTEQGNLIFPIPISDVGTATFNKSEKGLLMMRYIRKYLEVIQN